MKLEVIAWTIVSLSIVILTGFLVYTFANGWILLTLFAMPKLTYGQTISKSKEGD